MSAAAVDISLFRFTKIFLSADDVPHECRRRRREQFNSLEKIL